MAAILPLTMPKFGLAMTEGMVAAWQKQPGETIRQGEEIADIETSKITSAYESPVSGKLRRQVLEAGTMAPVGALIGVVADDAVPDAEIDAFIADFQSRFAASQAEAGAEAAGPERVQTAQGTAQYLAAGPAEAPVILFIHGFGGDLNNWMFLQPALAENFRTIALDLPGHGGSTKQVPAPDAAGLAGFVLAAMDALGIPAAHLVGHSMGGAVALAMAQASAERVLSLSLISPAGLGVEINRGYIEGFIEARRGKHLTPLLQSLFADPTLVGQDMVETVLRYKRLDGVEAALRAIASAQFPEGRQAASLRGVLDTPHTPAQVIWGRRDAIIPAAHAENLPAHVKVTLFDEAGHMAQMERPADTAERIASLAGGGI